MPLYRRSFVAGAVDIVALPGIKRKKSSLRMKAEKNGQFAKLFSERVDDYIETVADAMQEILNEAAEDNLDGDEIEDLINEEFEDFAGDHADMLAATEVGAAVNSARDFVMRQVVELGSWITAEDDRVRETHVIYGDAEPKPIGFNYAKLTGGDYELKFPVDPDCTEGSEVINCFLPGTVIRSGQTILAASKAWYTGPARIIETDYARLSVTANHPILTDRGWIPAHEVRKGDQLLSDRGDVHAGVLGHENDQEGAVRIEDLFDAIRAKGRPRLVMVGALDFHGEGDRITGQVDVVSIESLGLRHGEAVVSQDGRQVGRVTLARFAAPLSCEGPSGQFGTIGPSSAVGIMGGPNLIRPAPFGHTRPLQGLSLGLTPRGDAVLAQHAADRAPGDPEAFRELKDGGAGLVTSQHVRNVVTVTYDGPVYDVQTTTGLVHTPIVARNCRCFLQPFGDVEMDPSDLSDFLGEFGMDASDLLERSALVAVGKEFDESASVGIRAIIGGGSRERE